MAGEYLFVDFALPPADLPAGTVGFVIAWPDGHQHGDDLTGVFFLSGSEPLAGLGGFTEHLSAIGAAWQAGHRDPHWMPDDRGRMTLAVTVADVDLTVPDTPAALLEEPHRG